MFRWNALISDDEQTPMWITVEHWNVLLNPYHFRNHQTLTGLIRAFNLHKSFRTNIRIILHITFPTTSLRRFERKFESTFVFINGRHQYSNFKLNKHPKTSPLAWCMPIILIGIHQANGDVLGWFFNLTASTIRKRTDTISTLHDGTRCSFSAYAQACLFF